MSTATFNTDGLKFATDSFAKTMQAGVKMQEETTRFWSDMNTRAADDFRNRVEKLADELAPFNKKNVDRFQRMFDEQATRGMNFFRTAIEMNPFMHPVSNPTEWMERGSSFCKAAFETVRETMESTGKATQDFTADMQAFTKRCETVTTTAAPAMDNSKRPTK